MKFGLNWSCNPPLPAMCTLLAMKTSCKLTAMSGFVRTQPICRETASRSECQNLLGQTWLALQAQQAGGGEVAEPRRETLLWPQARCRQK